MALDANFYRLLLDNLSDGIYFVDRDRKIIFWNKGAERILGYSHDQVAGLSCADNLSLHVDGQGTPLCIDSCPLDATIDDGRFREAEVFLRDAKGHPIPVYVRTSPIYDPGGEIIGALEVFSDNGRLPATAKRGNEVQTESFKDELTGIGNRKFITAQVEACLIESQMHQLTSGVFFININQFKAINDYYGRATGDRVLREVASTLQNNIRATDYIGRWGGDEFVIVLYYVNQMELNKIAQKIRSLVSQIHMQVEGESVHIQISLGTTLTTKSDTMETLLKRAENLLYENKAAR